MTLQQLIYFQTLARELNFTRAAELLCITQPNLSHAIRLLETELGVPLFSRAGRMVTLTRHGALYLEYVNRALGELREGQTALEEYTQPGKGTVNLSYLSSLAEYIPFLASHYLMDNPELHTHFQMTQMPHYDICREIEQMRIDIGFSTAPESPDLESYHLGSHRSVIIVSDRHPFAGRSSVSLRELDGQNYVAYSRDCKIRQLLDELLARYGVEPVIVSELLYDNLVYGMVSANFGVAIVPEPMGVAPRHIHTLRIEEDDARRDIYMIWPRDSYLSPAAARFREYIIQNQLTLHRFRETILQ